MGAVSGQLSPVILSCVDDTDLASKPIGSLMSGDIAYVEAHAGTAEGPLYFLSTTSVAAVDGTGVLATSAPQGRWLSVAYYSGSPAGVTAFADVAALEAFDDASSPNGTVAYVATLRASWSKVVESPAPVGDGITVVPTASGDGGWYRSTVASPSWSSQSAWFVAATSGDDENDGSAADAAHALATVAEFFRRVPVLTESVTVTITEDTTEAITGQIAVAPGVDGIVLSLRGDPIVLETGTINTVSAPNPATATNLPGVLTALDGALAPIDWPTLGGDGKHFVEVTGGAKAGYATVVIDSTGGTTAYTPEWTYLEQGFEVPAPGDPIRVLQAITCPSIKLLVSGGAVVEVKYLHLTDETTYSSIQAAPFRWDGAAIETTRFDCCRLNGPFNSTGSSKQQACILDADSGSYTIFGLGALRLIGCGIDGSLSHSSSTLLFADGTVIMVGTLRISGDNTDGTSTRPQLSIGTHGLGIFGIALSTTGLTVVNADVVVNGPLYGKTHLRGLSVSRGGALMIKSTLAPATQLTLTGTTELALTTPNGIGAGLVVPIVAGIPTGAGAAIATWANWATLNKQVINFGDLTRIVGIA